MTFLTIGSSNNQLYTDQKKCKEFQHCWKTVIFLAIDCSSNKQHHCWAAEKWVVWFIFQILNDVPYTGLFFPTTNSVAQVYVKWQKIKMRIRCKTTMLQLSSNRVTGNMYSHNEPKKACPMEPPRDEQSLTAEQRDALNDFFTLQNQWAINRFAFTEAFTLFGQEVNEEGGNVSFPGLFYHY